MVLSTLIRMQIQKISLLHQLLPDYRHDVTCLGNLGKSTEILGRLRLTQVLVGVAWQTVRFDDSFDHILPLKQYSTAKDGV